MRRAISNPPNPFAKTEIEWDELQPDAKLQVFEQQARTILSRNDSPDLDFRWSLNPYRGCYHGCVYCYARPTHEYLDWGSGTDFERKIIVKVNAPALLRKRLHSKRWSKEPIMFSGITDCYQPLEASYELTRQCLEVCLAYNNPVGIITKGANVLVRDIDLLQALQTSTGVNVYISIPFASDALASKFEPFASRIERRFSAIRQLAEAGISVGVALAPIIPGINEHQISSILRRASECGAKGAFMVLLRLPGNTDRTFWDTMQKEFPDRAQKTANRLKRLRVYDPRGTVMGSRMKGEGTEWEVIHDLFKLHCKKNSLEGFIEGNNLTTVRLNPPSGSHQNDTRTPESKAVSFKKGNSTESKKCPQLNFDL